MPPPRCSARRIGLLFQRIQELTLAGRPDPEIAGIVSAEAERAFDLLEPSLARYAIA